MRIILNYIGFYAKKIYDNDSYLSSECNNMLKLSDLKIGERGKVASIQQCSPLYRHKLLAMGLTHGTEFTLVRKAPLGDPMVLMVRGFALSLRQGESTGVEVEKL